MSKRGTGERWRLPLQVIKLMRCSAHCLRTLGTMFRMHHMDRRAHAATLMGRRRLPAVNTTSLPGVAQGATGAELARVLGGGVVPGSLTLVGGDPGVGFAFLSPVFCFVIFVPVSKAWFMWAADVIVMRAYHVQRSTRL